MESAELTHFFDAIAGGTCADRFLSSLAGNGPDHASFPLPPDLSMPPTSFDMPVVPAHPSPPFDNLPHSQSPVPPASLVPQLHTDMPFIFPEYSLPNSAVTGSYGSTSNSVVQDHPIQKNHSKPKNRFKKEPFIARAPVASAPNMSSASDISTVQPVDEISASHSRFEYNHNPHPNHQSTNDQPKKETTMTPLATLQSPLAAPAPSTTNHITPSPQPKTTSSSASAAPKSHTRKCREKVTRQFENLLEVLPRPRRGVEVKHKAQILDYTIKMFRELLVQRTFLQAEIALASRAALSQWLNNAIISASAALKREARAGPVPLATILEPFLGLYCVKKNWAYGEMWLTDPQHRQASLASCLFNSDNKAVLKRLHAFATESRSRFQAPAKLETGIISRAVACQRPEWLEQPSLDPSVFDRADLARAQGICVVEAVPVLLGKNKCTAVLLFADVKPHKFSAAEVSVAFEYVEVLGDGYLQYLRETHNRVAPTIGAGDGRLHAKPIYSAAVKPRTSVPPLSNSWVMGNVGGTGLASGVDMVSQEDTSARFFSDADLMAHDYS